MFVEVPEWREDLRSWEIFVDPDDGLCWCVVLAALMPHVENENELQKRLEIIRGHPPEEVSQHDCELIKYITNYNPFRNRFACYHNDVKSLVGKLKNRVPTYQQRLDVLLKNVSKLIEGTITVFYESKGAVVRKQKYPSDGNDTKNDAELAWTGNINLVYYKKSKENKRSQFSFVLPDELSTILQAKAFSNLLRNDIMLRIIDKTTVNEINKFNKAKGNFLILLLKGGFVDILHKLLDSPPYNLNRLLEAGYGTDPTEKDSCMKTAFFYSLKIDWKLMYKLYNYATRKSRWLNNSPRNATLELIRYLEKVTTTLNDTKMLLGEMDGLEIKRLKEMICFHEYLYEMSVNIHELENRFKDNESNVEPCVEQAKKAKEIILNVVSVYKNFFNMKSSTEAMNEVNQFENFQNNFIFFQNLDYNFYLFFFDKLFSLKNSLRLSADQYEIIESSTARYIFFSNRYLLYHSSKNKGMKKLQRFIENPTPESKHYLLLFMLIYLERLSFEKDIENFHQCLESTVVSEENAHKMLSAEKFTLTSVPLIKDDMLLYKLKLYLDEASKVKFTESEKGNEESILVIERALQVLGEALKTESGESVTVIKSLLVSYLPIAMGIDLRKIRDCLVHKYDVPARFKAMGNTNMFVEIQKEIRSIKTFISPIYQIHEHRLQKYIYEKALAALESCELSEANTKQLKRFDRQISDTGHSILENYFLKQTNKSLKDHCKHFSSKLDATNMKIKNFYLKKVGKRFFIKDNNHFSKHVAWIEYYPGNSGGKVNETDIGQINVRFECITVFLKFIVDEVMYDFQGKEKLLEKLSNAKFKVTHSEDIYHNLDDCKRLKSDILKSLKIIDVEFSEIEKKYNVLYAETNIHKLRQMLCSKNVFEGAEGETEKESRRKIREQEHYTALDKLKASLTSGPYLEGEELDSTIKMLVVRKPQKVFEQYQKRKLSFLSNLEFHEETHKKQQKSVEKQQIQTNTPDRKLEFFCLRVDQLHSSIIITPDYHVNHLWKFAKSEKAKDYIHDLVVKFFIRKKEIRPLIEILYLDCLGILYEKNESSIVHGLKHLWFKENRLFAGSDLRNAVAHGNPLFELIGNNMDFTDFPNEMVLKILELISEKNTIDAIYKIYEKTQCTYDQFKDLLKSDERPELAELFKIVKEDEKWNEYALLLQKTV